jgi:hypothetical protein
MRTREIPFVEQIPTDNSVAIVKTLSGSLDYSGGIFVEGGYR